MQFTRATKNGLISHYIRFSQHCSCAHTCTPSHHPIFNTCSWSSYNPNHTHTHTPRNTHTHSPAKTSPAKTTTVSSLPCGERTIIQNTRIALRIIYNSLSTWQTHRARITSYYRRTNKVLHICISSHIWLKYEHILYAIYLFVIFIYVPCLASITQCACELDKQIRAAANNLSAKCCARSFHQCQRTHHNSHKLWYDLLTGDWRLWSSPLSTPFDVYWWGAKQHFLLLLVLLSHRLSTCVLF